MRSFWLLTISHGVSSLTGAGVAFALGRDAGLSATSLLAVGFGLAIPLLLSFALSARLRDALRQMVKVVAKGNQYTLSEVGIGELDLTARQLGDYAQRWTDANAKATQQSQEVVDMLLLLDRRMTAANADPATAASRLRSILAGVASQLQDTLQQIATGAHETTRSLDQIVEDADSQGESTAIGRTFVEQVTEELGDVVASSTHVDQSLEDSCSATRTAVDHVSSLINDMTQLGSQLERQQQKLRTLGDHSREIGALIDRIGSIAARTDLLALNASIESVRAGEHGRGFAMVAEEIHRLAEQSAQTIREVTTLLESSQSETQESIQAAIQEQNQLESELDLARSTATALERSTRSAAAAKEPLTQVSTAARRLQGTVHQLTATVDDCSSFMKSVRSRGEKLRWTVKALHKLTDSGSATLAALGGPQRLNAAARWDDDEDHGSHIATEDTSPVVAAGEQPATQPPSSAV